MIRRGNNINWNSSNVTVRDSNTPRVVSYHETIVANNSNNDDESRYNRFDASSQDPTPPYYPGHQWFILPQYEDDESPPDVDVLPARPTVTQDRTVCGCRFCGDPDFFRRPLWSEMPSIAYWSRDDYDGRRWNVPGVPRVEQWTDDEFDDRWNQHPHVPRNNKRRRRRLVLRRLLKMFWPR